MAKKPKTVFMCTDCGNEYSKWQGQCSFCGSWNTIVEQKVTPLEENDSRRRTGKGKAPVKLASVGSGKAAGSRITSGIGELDRVLGGGIVPGSLVLISGEPGIGKSTLIIQTAANIASRGDTVLYVSGEESEEQVKLRADRVCCHGEFQSGEPGDGFANKQCSSGAANEQCDKGVANEHCDKGVASEHCGRGAANKQCDKGVALPDSLYIFPETNIESVADACENLKPAFLIIDSIQTMYSTEVESTPGSVTQIRACSNVLMKLAKSSDIPVFIVAHVNKSGDLAGPKTIEHMVDCVLNFNGERDKDLRILRSFKNRFGTTDEIGAFQMCSKGMVEVRDLSGSLIESGAHAEEGSVISASYEGSRAVFFEIQALVSKANAGFARRTSIGIDNNRLNMILAVLEKKAGIRLIDFDVYVNVAGGVKPGSPATDLAVALAVLSSYRERTSPRRVVAVGEVGLTGRLRAVHNLEKIVAEAERLGYDAAIIPSQSKLSSKAETGKIQLLRADTIRDAIAHFFNK